VPPAAAVPDADGTFGGHVDPNSCFSPTFFPLMSITPHKMPTYPT
jgi:hypothetical protein